MSIDFDRERAWWDAKAPFEETDRADEAISRALRWRELECHLPGVRTILDVGGAGQAPSRFACQRGLGVTHLDLSPAMLDLVLATDGAISFCGPLTEQALAESCRVGHQTVFVTVLYRTSLLAQWVAGSIQVAGHMLPAVEAMAVRGEWRQDEFPENAALAQGCTQDYVGQTRGFLPGELRSLIADAGFHIVRCGGIGSLANLVGRDVVARVLEEEHLLSEFLGECERYDREILPDGPGTGQRWGLIAVGRRTHD